MAKLPERIVCMTEESVETLYTLGAQERIVGISSFVCRPKDARNNHPIVSAFTHANIDKILELKPDLVLGHSDIQKDIARELINAGVDVWIANHRSIEGILNYVFRLGHLVGKGSQAAILVQKMEEIIFKAKNRSQNLTKKPLVYVEEWDEPMITAIEWFSELVELAGGNVMFKQKSTSGKLAKDRFVSWEEVCLLNPDIMLVCWCGKKMQEEKIRTREKANTIGAIAQNWLLELDPAIFLQPGPAPVLEGIPLLQSYFDRWQRQSR